MPAIGTGRTTAFSNVTYFDGSDASGKAGSLTPVQGQNLVAATGQAVTDAGTSPFVTGLDVSGVDISGLGLDNVRNYGWQAAARLAPGAVAVVTFAVDLPADANPKNAPFNFSLNVTSVQDGVTLTSLCSSTTARRRATVITAQFPTSGGTSLPAYYDLKNVGRTGGPFAAVLCSFDGATVSNISSSGFPQPLPGEHDLTREPHLAGLCGDHLPGERWNTAFKPDGDRGCASTSAHVWW